VHNTEPVFFSAPHPLSRQLAATWISGVMLSVMTGAVVALRFVIAGDSHALLAWCAGAALHSALWRSLSACGRARARAFEAIYTGLCYAVIQQAAPLDFMGAVATASAKQPAISVFYGCYYAPGALGTATSPSQLASAASRSFPSFLVPRCRGVMFALSRGTLCASALRPIDPAHSVSQAALGMLLAVCAS
jgi:hypothetical protein